MRKKLNWFKKYFIPHKHNEYKPHFLRTGTAVIILAVVLFIETLFIVQVFVIVPNSGLSRFFGSIMTNTLVDLTNSSRLTENLPQLRDNPLLEAAALMKAEDMATKGYFSHTSPDGKTPWQWFQEAGYSFGYAGENLALNFSDSKDVIDAWLKSPAHRANILNKHFTEIGIGTATGIYENQEVVFIVQFFGTPVAATVDTSNKKTAALPKPSPIQNIEEIAASENFVAVKGASSVEPVSAGTIDNGKSQASTFFYRLISSPRSLTNYLYFMILTIVAVALMLVIFTRTKNKHPAVIVNGIIILVIISSLIVVNQFISLNIIQTKIF